MNVRHTDIDKLREDLAAAFQLCHHFGWDESVANHFSVALPDGSDRILLNPRWQHFATIRPQDLLLLDIKAEPDMTAEGAPDPSAWAVHSTLHREAAQARVILHCHAPYSTAMACLKDPTLLPIDNNTARFHGRIGYDLEFGGISDNAEEAAHVVKALGDKDVLIMGNHGVTITGETVPEAFEDLYYFEKAAKTLLLAYAANRPLSVLSDDVARNTAEGWKTYRGMADKHFAYLKTLCTL